MKHFLSRAAALAMTLVMIFSLAACGGSGGTSAGETGAEGNGGSSTPAVSGVSLDVTSVTLGPGDTQRLNATVSYSDGTTDSAVEWSSSDELVASVTRGVITAKGSGTATVTAASGGQSAACAVSVEDITVEISAASLDLERGAEAQLTASVMKGSTTAEETLVWSTSDDRIASVDASGKVIAVGEGTATVTAQRADANQKAVCTVTVTWTRPEGYAPIDYYEQNKVPADTWGYWNDPANYVGGMSEMYEAYYQPSENSEAGRANFTFAVNSRSEDDLDFSIIQITYRSAVENGGRLSTNHDYSLTLDLTSSVAGTVRLNRYQGEEENQFDIEAGTNTLTAAFRHGDWGTIFPSGVYDNVESAVFLLLGNLGNPGETVTVSVDNVHWTDLGESEEATEQPSFEQPVTSPEEIPVLDAAPIALVLDAENAVAGEGNSGNEQYEISTGDGGMSYTVEYAGVWGSTYSFIAIPIPEEAAAADCNTFAVTVTNNSENPMAIRFDVNGTNPAGENSTLDLVYSSIATVGIPNTDLTWGGTTLTVDPGATTTLYLIYDAATERGTPAELNVAFDSAWEASPAEHNGSVSISEFRFGTAENG